MPATIDPHDQLAAAQAETRRAHEQYREAHDREVAWACYVADELVTAGLKLLRFPAGCSSLSLCRSLPS